jgi:ech hydrogenase subunit D
VNPQVFIDINPEEIRDYVKNYHARKWRFVQICGSTVTAGVELLYTFSDGEPIENLRTTVTNNSTLPSISDLYFNAFFFENETHDLYGINFKGMAIDFGGKFYPASVLTPMNPIAALDATSLEGRA